LCGHHNSWDFASRDALQREQPMKSQLHEVSPNTRSFRGCRKKTSHKNSRGGRITRRDNSVVQLCWRSARILAMRLSIRSSDCAMNERNQQDKAHHPPGQNYPIRRKVTPKYMQTFTISAQQPGWSTLATATFINALSYNRLVLSHGMFGENVLVLLPRYT
jgi:hypothetical protein